METQFIEIQQQRDAIALEFLNMNTGERLDQLLTVAKDTMTRLVGLVSRDAPAIAPLTAKQEEFLKTVAGRNYANLMQMPVRVPEGLKVPYLQYLHVLDGAAEYAGKIMERIAQFSVVLGQLVNEHNYQTSTAFNRNHYATTRVQRAHLHSVISGCFQPGSTKAESTYGAVVERNADWREVFKTLNLVSERVNGINRRMLDKKIEECSHSLDILETKAKRGDLKDITPQMISELAAGTLDMAHDVEFYVNIWYKAQAISEAVNKTTSQLVTVYQGQ
jgi:hypothetical protein